MPLKKKGGKRPTAAPAPHPAAQASVDEQAKINRLARYGTSTSLANAEDGMAEENQKEWLDRSREWRDLVQGMNGHKYVPQRVLGGGSSGTVGLWALQPRDELDEDEEDDDDESFRVSSKRGKSRKQVTKKAKAIDIAAEINDEKSPPRHLVIKQSIGDGEKGMEARLQLQWESKLLHQIMGTETDHVVKIYKGFYLDGGSGTDARRDPVPFTNDQEYSNQKLVARIYIEYGRGGSMDSYMELSHGHTQVIPEERIWRIAMCIFKGLLVLERGTEEHTDPPPPLTEAWGDPIAHFDIKPENIVIGERDDGIHQRLNTFKLADFGLAMKVPTDPTERAEEKWMNEVWWRKSLPYAPPKEQYFWNHNQRSNITTKTGIWSAAASLCELCCKTLINQEDMFVGANNVNTSGAPEKILNPEMLPYSQRLIQFLCDCLAFNPDQRPEISEIVRRIQTVVDAYDAIPRDISDNPMYDPAESNVLYPSGELQELKNLMASKIIYEEDIFEYQPGNEPQPDKSPERGLPLFFAAAEVDDENRPKRLVDYPYKPLYDALTAKGKKPRAKAKRKLGKSQPAAAQTAPATGRGRGGRGAPAAAAAIGRGRGRGRGGRSAAVPALATSPRITRAAARNARATRGG